jgi:hypothetical protein
VSAKTEEDHRLCFIDEARGRRGAVVIAGGCAASARRDAATAASHPPTSARLDRGDEPVPGAGRGRARGGHACRDGAGRGGLAQRQGSVRARHRDAGAAAGLRPELNPAERTRLYLRERFLSAQMCHHDEAILSACCIARSALAAEPERICSLASLPYIARVHT